MIHKISINDSTKEGKLILEIIKAMKPSQKSVQIDSPDFSYGRLVLGEGGALTNEELELLSQQAEKSKGIPWNKFKTKIRRKIISANNGNRIKKAS